MVGRHWQIALILLFLSVVLAPQAALAGFGDGQQSAPAARTTQYGVEVNAPGYEQSSGGSTVPPPVGGGSGSAPSSDVVYLLLWHTECTGGGCAGSDIQYMRCPGKPFNRKNEWYVADVYTTTADGPRPGNMAESNVCFNIATIRTIEKGGTKPKPPVRLNADQVKQVFIKPKWSMQPEGKSLVNKPMIVAVDSPRNVQFDGLRLQGSNVRIRAHVKEYEWAWGDGTPTTTTTDRGKRYDGGTCEVDDCAGYVNHTYASSGKYAITLTIRWTAQYSVDGGPWRDVPGEVELSADHDVQVVSADTVLVAPDGD